MRNILSVMGSCTVLLENADRTLPKVPTVEQLIDKRQENEVVFHLRHVGIDEVWANYALAGHSGPYIGLRRVFGVLVHHVRVIVGPIPRHLPVDLAAGVECALVRGPDVKGDLTPCCLGPLVFEEIEDVSTFLFSPLKVCLTEVMSLLWKNSIIKKPFS